MRRKYLRNIHERFHLPLLKFPMLREKIRGIEALDEAARSLTRDMPVK